MSEQPATPATAPAVPDWDVADRMRKALRTADVGVQEMADYLGVARNTVSTWINGRITPNRQTMRLWSLRCGVPYEWIATGECAVRDSNPEPADLVSAQVIAFPAGGRIRRTVDRRRARRRALARPLVPFHVVRHVAL